MPFSQEDFNDDPSSVNISEVFVDYVHLERTTGKAIADAIVKSLHDMGFDIENLRGQGYDGASAMSSSIQGVNGRIREIAPLALYSHCKSHVLNLSIASSCKQMNIRIMIKTHLRNSMTVERLAGLALMHIHHSVEIELDVVLKMFIDLYNRRLFSGIILYD